MFEPPYYQVNFKQKSQYNVSIEKYELGISLWDKEVQHTSTLVHRLYK